MPRLMQDQNVLEASPFHSITEVEVKLDLDPKNGDIYLPESWNKDAFAISKPGFMKLFEAAGMEEIPDQCISNMPEDRIYFAKSVIKWTQADGTEVILTGDKTMDFRKGGARWTKTYEKALDSEMQAWGLQNKMPKGQKMTPYGQQKETYADWSIRILVELESNPEHGAILTIMRATAQHKANRDVTQKAQYGGELAQTGAITRAVKAQLGLKSTYSEKELLEGFTIIRSTFRWDMLSAHLGEERAKQLKDAFVMKAMGLKAGDLMQLTPGPQQAPEPSAESLFEDDDTIEGELVVDDEEAVLFLTPIQDETSMRIRNKMMRFHGWRDFNVSKASERTMWLFHCVYGDLTEGFALLLIMFYDKIQAQKDLNIKASEITKQAKHLKEQIDQCVIQKRMWKEPKKTAEQLPLEKEEKDGTEGSDQTTE